MNNIILFEITQPIGTFYFGKINSSLLREFAFSNSRESGKGVQRKLSDKRLNEIAEYCNDPDATFPTPIILSINTSTNYTFKPIKGMDGIFNFSFDISTIEADIIDGQHRLNGIALSKNNSIDLPIVIMFDLTEEEKAYVFSTINSNQEKVSKSLIYDLFELSKERSPQKTCHEIARVLNSEPDSPFYTKLKMLGNKQTPNSSLSQGTFVTYLLGLITKEQKKDMIDIKNHKKLQDNSNFIFRKYFIDNEDEVILKILCNYFNAVKQVFPEEWDDSNKYILSKTTGYGALIKALKSLYLEGIKQKDLSQIFFVTKFSIAKENLLHENKKLTAEDFTSGNAGQNELAKYIIG